MSSASETARTMIEGVGGALSGRRDLLLCVIATAISALPLAFIRFAPLHDFPFHLARMKILDDLVHGGEQARYYEISTFLLPNIGMDAIVLALSQALPVETATVLFLVLAQFLIVAGVTYLHRSFHEADDLTPFFAAVLGYNTVWTLGFLNYVLGLGLLLFAIARHVRVAGHGPQSRFVSAFCWSVVLLFAHVAAFALYAVVAAGIEIQRHWPDLLKAPVVALLRLLQAAAPILAVVLLFLLVSPTGEEASSPMKFTGASVYEFLRMKVWHATQTFSGHQNRMLDLASTFAILLLVVWGVAFARLRVARAGLLALGLLSLAFLAAPATLLSGSYLDARLPIAIALVGAGMAAFGAMAPTTRRVLFAAVAGLLLVRSAVLAGDWSKYDRVDQDFMKAFACLPKGSILFAARAELGDLQMFWQPAVKHFPSLAVLTGDRFVPSIFAHPSQQPIRVRRDLQAIYDFQSPALHKVKDAAAFSGFLAEVSGVMKASAPRVRQDFGDRVYVMLLEPRVVGAHAMPGTKIVASGELFTLYRVVSDDAVSLTEDTCEAAPDVH